MMGKKGILVTCDTDLVKDIIKKCQTAEIA